MICLDASVLVQWLLPEAHSAQVAALLKAAISSREVVAAPPLLPFEIANALRKRVVRNLLPQSEVAGLVQRFDSLPISLRTPEGLHRQALDVADRYGLPAIYDGCYIVIAQRLGCDLWTDDQRLLDTLGGRLPLVRWIGNYVIPTEADESNS